MHIYSERIFEENEYKKAKRFQYRHKGWIKFDQARDENGRISLVYVVYYIKREKTK